ncbi:MAG: iron-containing alcohol dehydrogenase [Rhodospirillaceae bacterium]|jgi:maleylacetate reductase|nr:iron-containing alcohol dehydrogenase [Rhodospirillaceae bacterium]
MRSGGFIYPETNRVLFGDPFANAVLREADRLDARRIFVIASGTLSRTTDVIDQLRAVLGGRFAGLRDQMAAHTPRIDVVEAANAARDAGADLILTVGGGSVTDGGKMVVLCLANDISDPDKLDDCRTEVAEDGTQQQPDLAAPSVRMVTVPTTLSAGEFNFSAGCTDTIRHVKHSYRHRMLAPVSIILDPAITVHTPQWLWLSTGVRAVDHGTEDLCSLHAQPYVDGTAIQALKLLGRGLPASQENPNDLDARLDCLTGAWLSMVGSAAGVTKGASHGIGHVLGGTAKVPHGHTSCVMLPSVLRYNHAINADQQAMVADALGRPGEEAATVVGDLITSLDQPRTLRDVNVQADQLDTIASHAMHDRWVHTNPRKISSPNDVREILDMAW